jgi:hypothetical protein
MAASLSPSVPPVSYLASANYSLKILHVFEHTQGHYTQNGSLPVTVCATRLVFGFCQLFSQDSARV